MFLSNFTAVLYETQAALAAMGFPRDISRKSTFTTSAASTSTFNSAAASSEICGDGLHRKSIDHESHHHHHHCHHDSSDDGLSSNEDGVSDLECDELSECMENSNSNIGACLADAKKHSSESSGVSIPPNYADFGFTTIIALLYSAGCQLPIDPSVVCTTLLRTAPCPHIMSWKRLRAKRVTIHVFLFSIGSSVF